jgi:hypothetical protein
MFESGAFSGLGELKWRNGVIYRGNFFNGSEEGTGVKTWPDGQRYAGEWRQGRKNGFGTLFFAKTDGSKRRLHSGHFVDDSRSGNGTLEWQNGNFYKGEFKDGNRHGLGLETDSDGKYQGQWANDVRNGYGRFDFNENDEYKSLAYIGNYEDNVRSGHGAFYWLDRDMYEGQYENGVREGHGVYYWPSGNRYEGQFENNAFNGEGTKFSADGTVIFKGQWKDGEQQN